MYSHHLFIFLYALKQVHSSPIALRQSSKTTTSIDTFIQQVQTTIYAISQIKINGTTTACTHNTTEARLNSTGLDGNLGLLLLCEDASGVTIFPNITQAEQQLEFALSGLQTRKNGTKVADCNRMSLDTLGQAGIDADAVKLLICDASPQPGPTASTGILWANSTVPRLATGYLPGSTSFRTANNTSFSALARSISNEAAIRLDVSIPLTADFVSTISPARIPVSSFISQPIGEQLALSIPLTADFSTNLATHTVTSIITTLISGDYQSTGPLTVTSTAAIPRTSAHRDPRTVTIWQIVYVTAILPTTSTSLDHVSIPLTAAFSTQQELIHTITMTTTTSMPSVRTPMMIASTGTTGRNPSTVTVWQIVYMTAIEPSSTSSGLKIPLTATFETELVPVHTVTMTTTTSLATAHTPLTVTSTGSMSMAGRDPGTVTIWQIVYLTGI